MFKVFKGFKEFKAFLKFINFFSYYTNFKALFYVNYFIRINSFNLKRHLAKHFLKVLNKKQN